jgi:protein-tyrosine phosphatase
MRIPFWRIAASLMFLGLTTCAVQAATPLRVAFVDTGNTGRSMTSAALAQKWASDNNSNVVVISRAVNLNPYNVVPEPDFVQLLAPKGLDVTSHRAASFDKGVVTFSDFIFVMTAAHRDRILADYPEAKTKVFLMAEYATGTPTEVLDAYGQPPEFYAKVFAQLNELVPLIMEKLPRK